MDPYQKMVRASLPFPILAAMTHTSSLLPQALGVLVPVIFAAELVLFIIGRRLWHWYAPATLYWRLVG